MSNAYAQLYSKHQKEVNEFPMEFAFNQKQFEEGMIKLGLQLTDTDKIYSLEGTGGFYRKSDAQALHEMFDRHSKERQEAIDNDKTGDGYIYDMFNYELANHEYSYTGEVEDTLDALGLTLEEVYKNKALSLGFKKACNHQMECDCF